MWAGTTSRCRTAIRSDELISITPIPSARSMCDPRDLNRRRASAIAGLHYEITGTDTLLGACRRDRNVLKREKHNHPLLFSFESWLCSAPFIMIFVHNMLEQTISFTKAHRVLHVHLLRGRQAERRAFSPEGRNSWAGFQSQRAALDLMRKEVYRGSPIFIPSILHLRFPRALCLGESGGGTMRNAGESSLLKESFPGAKHT